MNVFKNADFVCIYGWDEELYKQALAWVDESKRAVFVADGEHVSKSRFVKIYSLDSPLQTGPLAKKIAWSAVFCRLKVVMLKENREFHEELEKCHLAAGVILSEAADFSLRVLKNARANSAPYRQGLLLKGAFTGIPAVIVGAGPSLKKNKHLLPLFEKKALLFAGGSSLNTVGTEPHFAAAIDPIAPPQQFKKHPFKKTPFCYQSRLNPENFSLMSGEKLLFPDSFSDAINWIHGEEFWPSGWTVGNFLTAIALHLGCSPIILVGMDLCYVGGRKYAELDVAPGVELIEARGVWTQRDWLMAAQWTEEVAKGHHFINATEGGLLSLPKETLETVLQQLPNEWNLREMVSRAIERLPLCSPPTRWAEWDNSLRRCQQNPEGEIVSEKLLEPLWQIWKPMLEREVEADPTQSLEVHKELFFQRILSEHTR